jgi:hypothetical protein
VPQELIWRLYENDALGFTDLELLDEVGWRLLARCRSFIQAVEAVSGRVSCPVCAQLILHTGTPEEVLQCPACGWETTWGEFFSTIQHKQLSGAEPVVRLFQEFIRLFPQADDYSQKMLLVDQLIHGFHIYFKDASQTRTTAVNLIEGRYHEVVDFLDRLSYGPQSTPGTLDTYLKWRQTIDETAEKWGDEKLRRR